MNAKNTTLESVRGKDDAKSLPACHTKQPVDFWKAPLTIERNNFKFKSLSSFACNIAVGCSHACRFCYVPNVSTIRLSGPLSEYGITNPDEQWGEYVLLRPWNEKAFLASIAKAETARELPPDGNRAVIYCSTTDAYQTISDSDNEKTRRLNTARKHLVRRSLELILERSTLNVRILTRSPLARQDFDLYRRFGTRLLFGMSLPTLDNQLARIYEPHAPSPSQRLKTLQEAREAGLHVYVAMAPTYPECDEADLRRTMEAIRDLSPVTVFHEPINIRAENVQRIETHARLLGRTMNTAVFDNGANWRTYAIGQLMLVQKIAGELGLLDHLHLWPDASLNSKTSFLKIRKQGFSRNHPEATTHEKTRAAAEDQKAWQEFEGWISAWHGRISEWPTEAHLAGTASVVPSTV
jgi:DNA repair photolyase